MMQLDTPTEEGIAIVGLVAIALVSILMGDGRDVSLAIAGGIIGYLRGVTK